MAKGQLDATWLAVASKVGAPAGASVSDICAHALISGKVAAVSDVLASEAAVVSTDPYLSLLAAEVALRADPKQLFGLVAAIQSKLHATSELATWAAALLADFALSQTSPETLIPVLAGTYAPGSTLLGQFCALRIRRAQTAIVGLDDALWPSERESLIRLDDELVSLGAVEEAATTGCVRAAIDIVHAQPGIELILADVLATCDRLIALRTERSLTALMLALGACHLAEDAARMHELLGSSDIPLAPDSWQRSVRDLFQNIADYRRTLESAQLNAAERDFANLVGRFAQPWLLVAESHNFLDYDRIGPARATLALADSSGLMTAQTMAGLQALRARVNFLDHPDEPELASLGAVVGSYLSVGSQGQAALFALRASIDCRRSDRPRDARKFLAQAETLLQDRSWSRAERRLHHLALHLPHIAGPPRARIVMLSGDPQVFVDDQKVPLGRLTARLIALLAGSPNGVPIDSALECVYPDLDAGRARSRLNVLVHRLRDRLGHRGADMLVRTDSRLSLNSDLWEVDAWEFTRLSAIPSVEARTAAMRLYRNNFAGHVGVYDDALITVRRRLETLWCDVAIGLLADGALSPDLLADEADRLEIRYPRLLNALAEYHQ